MEMLTWALEELERRRRALSSAHAEIAALRESSASSSANWQAGEEAHRAEVGRLGHINDELLKRVRSEHAARDAQIAHDAQIASLCTLFTKIASDLADAKTLLGKMMEREH